MKKDPRDFIPLNPRDYLVLFSLTGGERHGYGIVKDAEAETDGAVKLDPSNLYRSVKRLIQDGLVEEVGRRLSAESDNERRKYYAITELGNRVVSHEASRLSKLADAARARNLISRTGRPA